MGSGFFLSSLFLCVLLILQYANQSRAREINVGVGKELTDEQQHAMDDHIQIYAHDDDNSDDEGIHQDHVIDHHHHHHHPSSHMDHMMNPALNVFLKLDDLKVGTKMPIYIPIKDPSTSPPLLSREEANTIPFSLTQLPDILELFSFSPESPQAKAMKETLEQCETKPSKGETVFCATSLESMLDSNSEIFGLGNQFYVLTTTHLTKPSTLLQNYTFLEIPKEILISKMVGCHTMPYPYAVYYCHNTESKNRLFKVLLGGDNGGRVDAAAICHMNTSKWDRDHVAFRMLGIKPGSAPVCHFFPVDNLVWVQSPDMI